VKLGRLFLTAAIVLACASPPSAEAGGAPNGSEAEGANVVSLPTAPEFTLALGDGTAFTLSAEARPVYLLFWAEW
jgi:hypothetical protein